MGRLTYSTVGMIWGTEDWRYHAEDTRKIARACADVGAPLSFMSINNYPTGMTGNELRTGKWGFRYATWNTGLPVMLSETGFTFTETLYPIVIDQGTLIRSALWEAIIAGAIGVHVFTWDARPWLTEREIGFGILTADRRPQPGFFMVQQVFQMLIQIDLPRLVRASSDPPSEVAFYWTSATDQM